MEVVVAEAAVRVALGYFEPEGVLCFRDSTGGNELKVEVDCFRIVLFSFQILLPFESQSPSLLHLVKSK